MYVIKQPAKARRTGGIEFRRHCCCIEQYWSDFLNNCPNVLRRITFYFGNFLLLSFVSHEVLNGFDESSRWVPYHMSSRSEAHLFHPHYTLRVGIRTASNDWQVMRSSQPNEN